MSVTQKMAAVLKYVPTLRLGASHVHAMLAIILMLVAVHVMVGHTYTPNDHTETSLCCTSPDINECSTNNGGCEHACANTDGSYVCSCNRGYELAANNHNCVGE